MVMNAAPIWTETVEVPKLAPLRRDQEVDVVVIGGGITGVTAAYLAKKSGATVALLEKDRFGMAETGHTTAHLTCATDLRLHELVEKFGRDHAQATWDAGLAAIHQIHEICEAEQIRSEFAWVPGYLHAPLEGGVSDEDRAGLERDAELAGQLGFDAEFLRKVPFVGLPGVRLPNQAKFHPLKYLLGLLKTIRGKGSDLFENSEVTEIEVNPVVVHANGHRIEAKYVIIATHVPLQGATGMMKAALFQSKLAPYTSYAVGAKIPSGTVPPALFWDTSEPYSYLRIDQKRGHAYAIFGGADHKTGQALDPEKHYEQIEKRLRKLFPAATIDHRWSGQVIETNDGLPYMGETAERQFVATGFSGNGMTFGTLGAMMAVDAYQGRKNPWSELFDVRRKTLSGAWNYLRENKDYPYYLLKEWLAKPSASSLRAVQRGQGKIVQVEGKKVAAFRDEKGKLSVRSAVCPHLGCIVRWNGAEKTWDCPCHGSRFQATGEVMGGPAETPLAEVEK